ERAGLNTLMGMGTVFAVLILLCLIISCFKFIPRIQASFGKDKKTKIETTKNESVDNTIAQIIEKEELTDDLELVAVITAAIAAAGTAGTAGGTDGFVVRSIKRVSGSRWNQA
ncbi:MAG TPA: OadG family protein, partial [Lachnospiraceae bacterium]|nr:OadG family protein [Lachnospiraceae bacterium]